MLVFYMDELDIFVDVCFPQKKWYGQSLTKKEICFDESFSYLDVEVYCAACGEVVVSVINGWMRAGEDFLDASLWKCFGVDKVQDRSRIQYCEVF